MDVVAAFRKEGYELDDDVAAACGRVCKDVCLTVEELVLKWEARANNLGLESGPTTADIRAIAAALEQSSRKRDTPSGSGPGTVRPWSSAKKTRIDSDAGLLRAPGIVRPMLDIDEYFHLDGAVGNGCGEGQNAARNDTQNDSHADGTPPAAKDLVKADSRNPTESPVVVQGDGLGISGEIHLPGDSDKKLRAAYQSREDAGTVIDSLNPHKISRASHTTPPRITPLTAFCQDSVKKPFLYMNDPTSGLVQMIRDRIHNLGEKILANRAQHVSGEDPKEESPGAFSCASPNRVLAVGRIRVDLDSGGDGVKTKLTPSSVVLEGKDGQLVRLNLDRLQRSERPLLLMPGFVVAVDGVNVDGRELDVHAIHDCAVSRQVFDPDTASSKAPETAQVVVAAGPYTLPDNLEYEPLDDLLASIEDRRPAVALLIGPFLDSTHKLVQGPLPASYDRIFEARVLRKVLRCAENLPHTSFVLMPSISDAHHDFVCPQPSFATRFPQLAHPRVHMLTNPSCFSVSVGSCCAVIGATSMPTLKDISADCLSRNMTDRRAAVASALLKQRSFYPQHPPSANVPIDSTHADKLELPSDDVDLLVLPSVLKGFVQATSYDTIVCNPGLLVKGNSGGGSFAVMDLPLRRRPSDLAVVQNVDALGEASRCDIVKL